MLTVKLTRCLLLNEWLPFFTGYKHCCNSQAYEQIRAIGRMQLYSNQQMAVSPARVRYYPFYGQLGSIKAKSVVLIIRKVERNAIDTCFHNA